MTRVTFQLRVDNLANDPSVNSFLDFTLPGGIPLMLGNYSGITVSDCTRALTRKRSPLGILTVAACTYIKRWPANTGPNIIMLWRLWGSLTWLYYRGWAANTGPNTCCGDFGAH